MEILLRCLSTCYPDPYLQTLDSKTLHGLSLLKKCLLILANLSAHIPDARKEILKFNVLEMVARTFQIQLIQADAEGTLYEVANFMRNLTQKINKVHLKKCVGNGVMGELMAGLVHMLHTGNMDIQRLVIETFLQLGESDNETFTDEAMKYE